MAESGQDSLTPEEQKFLKDPDLNDIPLSKEEKKAMWEDFRGELQNLEDAISGITDTITEYLQKTYEEFAMVTDGIDEHEELCEDPTDCDCNIRFMKIYFEETQLLVMCIEAVYKDGEFHHNKMTLYQKIYYNLREKFPEYNDGVYLIALRKWVADFWEDDISELKVYW